MAHELKRLQVLLHDAQIELERTSEVSKAANRKFDVQLREVNRLESQIESLTQKDLIVSEHALLRFIERGMGFDLNKLKESILTDDIKIKHKALGNGKYPINENMKAVVRDNVVVSITS